MFKLENIIGESLLWVLLMICFGFEIQMAIPGFLHISSTPVNILFRATYLSITLSLVIIGILDRKVTKRHFGAYALILFWLIYSLRLFYDMEYRDIWFMKNKSMLVYQFAFGSTFIPALATFYCAKYINLKNIEIKLFAVLFIGNFLTTYLLVQRYGHFSSELFRTVTMTGFQEEDGSISASLNYIAISIYGLMLLSTSFYNYFILRKCMKFKILYMFGILLGGVNLLLGASRGTTLVFILIVVPYLIFFYFKSKKLTFNRLYLFTGKLIFIIVVPIMAVFPLYISDGLLIVKRIQYTIDKLNNGEGDHRFVMWKSAIDQFYAHPIIGDRFVCAASGNHTAHNFFLEIPMATGLVGILLFLLIMCGLISRILTRAYTYSGLGPFILMLVIWMCSSLTSGSIWGWSANWILLSFILSYPKDKLLNRPYSY